MWVFHTRVCLSDRKSPQVSKTFLSILVDMNNILDAPLIFKSSSICPNPLVTVPSAPITTRSTVTFMFHSFFQFHSKVLVFFSLFAFFQFYPVVSQNSEVNSSACSLFIFFYYHCVWLSGQNHYYYFLLLLLCHSLVFLWSLNYIKSPYVPQNSPNIKPTPWTLWSRFFLWFPLRPVFFKSFEDHS